MQKRLGLTRPRQAVLDMVRQAHDHPTAAEVMERMQVAGQRFAYATVYNSLHYLTTEGLLQELQVGDGAARYDGRVDEHSHIICTRCKRIDEFESPDREDIVTRAQPYTSYKVLNVSLLFEGLCPDCQSHGQA